MKLNDHLTIFEKASEKFSAKKTMLKDAGIYTGIWLDSVVLKIQKQHWANIPGKGPQAGPGIFFSVWLNEKTIKEGKVYYNIHALKLRELKGYRITSRNFAEAFRKEFKQYQKHWPDVRTDFGPLTLMEGSSDFNDVTLEEDIVVLAEKFMSIVPLIDELLAQRIG